MNNQQNYPQQGYQQQGQGQQQQGDNSHFYSMFNSTIIGRLTRDPEIVTNNNKTFISFSIAVNQRNGQTVFVDISVNESRTTLFNMVKNLSKGRRVLAIGDVTLKEKEKGGSFVDLYPHDLRFMDSAGGNGGNGGQQQQQQPANNYQQGGQQPPQGYQQQPQQQQGGFAPQGQPGYQQQPAQGFPQHQQGGFAPQQQQGGFAPQGGPQGAPQGVGYAPR